MDKIVPRIFLSAPRIFILFSRIKIRGEKNNAAIARRTRGVRVTCAHAQAYVGVV